MHFKFTLLALAFACSAHAALPAPGESGAVDDPRYCGEPKRDALGHIARSTTQRARFVRVFPCPATLQVTGACKGWQVDHIIPLDSGGCDAPHNMQWLPDAIKTCASSACKDRWERTYHGMPRQRVTP
jgi:5-methylcytosine-specific restriction endonuclease McrA